MEQDDKKRKIHIAIATTDIAQTIEDYSRRLGKDPCVVIDGEYALWRTDSINMSIRQDKKCKTGELRHLGWEDPNAVAFTEDVDVNGIVWENFNAVHQADEIKDAWPNTIYTPEK